MNNKKHKLPQSNEKQIQANLKQAKQKSSSLAERKVEHTRELGLRFSPTAWAKLLYFRDKSDNEVGGFGITEPDDLLFVKEFITVKQEVTAVSVKFDDEAVANFFEDQVDLGRKPELWDAEYAANVKAVEWLREQPSDKEKAVRNELSGYALPYDFITEFGRMEPAERQFVLDELAERSELWEEESEVMFL